MNDAIFAICSWLIEGNRRMTLTAHGKRLAKVVAKRLRYRRTAWQRLRRSIARPVRIKRVRVRPAKTQPESLLEVIRLPDYIWDATK